MKSRQRKQLLSLIETGLLCRENISIIGLLTGMKRSVQQYDQLLLSILESMYKQSETLTHYAKEKSEVRSALAEHADYVSSLAYAFACNTKSHTLMTQFKHSYSSVFRSRDTAIVAVCTYIYKGLTEQGQKVKEWGIKKKDIEEFMCLIKKFEKLMTVPESSINGRAVHTKNLRERMHSAARLVSDEMDHLMRFFRQFPEFTAAYDASRKQSKEAVTQDELEKKIKEFYLAPKPVVLRRRKAAEMPAMVNKGL